MFARFDENPAMTLRVIKETKRYGRTNGRMHRRTDRRTDNVKTVYPLQTKFAGGINTCTVNGLIGNLSAGTSYMLISILKHLLHYTISPVTSYKQLQIFKNEHFLVEYF